MGGGQKRAEILEAAAPTPGPAPPGWAERRGAAGTPEGLSAWGCAQCAADRQSPRPNSANMETSVKIHGRLTGASLTPQNQSSMVPHAPPTHSHPLTGHPRGTTEPLMSPGETEA